MSLTNFVQLRLQTGITSGATSMVVFTPAAPFKLPDASGTLVLLDGLTHPTKAEIVTYSGLTDNGNGTHTVSGLVRGAEGTSAQVWSAQAYVIESVTAGVLAGLLGGKQATNANLDALAGLTGVADHVPYFAGAEALSLATLSAFGRSLIDDVDATAARTTLGLGTAATADVQTSTADTTAGRLLTVGAFGLGAEVVTTSTDLNTITRQGFYSFKDTTANTPVAGTYGTVIHASRLSSEQTQFAFVNTAASVVRIFCRNRYTTTPGVWGNWVELYHSGNTIKQTSPTDTTANALMAVGAFGLGATSPTAIGNFNEITRTGSYFAGSTAANRPSVPETYTIIHTQGNGPARAFQIANGVGSGRTFARTNFDGVWTSWQEIQTSANVQTSSTDTTAGRLMTVGAFGLGATTVPTLTDVSVDTIPTGFYQVASTAVGIPVAQTGFVLIQRAGSQLVSQTFYSLSGDSVFVRRKNGASWSSWRIEYNSANILGTVSQSAGVPTGAIIERGSNANGEYVRFADGTQICWVTLGNLAEPIGTSFFGGFRSSGRAWTFPAVFSVLPRCFGAPASSIDSFSVSAGGNTTTCTYFYTALVSQSAADRNVSLFAVGRWF